ncbi:beta-lactamase family protein [Actinomadura sp. ATCC 31491]|uniref:Beta-lactamase family protein n=1 Tax=Actinomadura luzonensis TaxID=2805427 RepID=A0ABT0G1R2_9ACTN|nr:serine hydrolase domain-containing protein [Actinomadura luzonensis]MCK2218482.1 beta-lactamase family protein [Actinomadura luzonensis]
MELIDRNTRRLLRLVDTLLGFSWIEAGRMRARFAPTDLAALTGEITAAGEAQLELPAATGRYQMEYVLADGSRRWMLFVGRGLADGGIREYCIDITDLKDPGTLPARHAEPGPRAAGSLAGGSRSRCGVSREIAVVGDPRTGARPPGSVVSHHTTWSSAMTRTRIAAALALAALAPALVLTAPAEAAVAEVPPINDQALASSIAGLPAADATAAEVRVSGTAGSWRGVSGVTDLKTRRPAEEGARFRAGSVTKVFTTAVVLQLVAEGRLSLDDTVQDRLPGLLPAAYPPVKLGQVLNHTSGLPAPASPGDFAAVYAARFDTITPEEYVRQAVRNPIEFTPGTQQHYLNINTFVAGLLIERVTGRSYEDEVASRILRPLGLRHSYYPGTSVKIRGRHNQGYQVVPEGFPGSFAYDGRRLVNVTEMEVTSTWASGDLITTAADLETFTKALFGGKIVPAGQLQPMFTVPRVKTYGTGEDAHYTSGLTELRLPGGILAYGKTGARYGSSTGIGATRDLSRVVVYSVNSTDAKAQGQNQRGLGIALAAFAPTATDE